MLWKRIANILAHYGPPDGFFANHPTALQRAAARRFQWDDDGITGAASDGSPCSISWQDLRSIQVISTGDRFGEEYFYAFESKDGRVCRIPQTLDIYHQHLLGWLRKLPGFSEETLDRAFKCTSKGTFLCWVDPAARSGIVSPPEPQQDPRKFHWDEDGVVGVDEAGNPLRMAWDELTRVTVVTTDDGPAACDVFFVLQSSNGQACVLPQELDPDGELLEQFQALNGFDNRAFAEAMKSTENASFLCWEKLAT